jgi:hypothetical protein
VSCLVEVIDRNQSHRSADRSPGASARPPAIVIGELASWRQCARPRVAWCGLRAQTRPKQTAKAGRGMWPRRVRPASPSGLVIELQPVHAAGCAG